MIKCSFCQNMFIDPEIEKIEDSYVCKNCKEKVMCQLCGEKLYVYTLQQYKVCSNCLNKIAKCSICNKYFLIEDTVEFNSSFHVCKSCLKNSTQFRYCSECEKYYTFDNFNDRYKICIHCLYEKYYLCYHCGNLVRKELAVNVYYVTNLLSLDRYNRVYCTDCFEEKFKTDYKICYCSKRYFMIDFSSLDTINVNRCVECINRYIDRKIFEHSYKPDILLFSRTDKDTDNLVIGIELEISFQNKIDKYKAVNYLENKGLLYKLYCKRDGSVPHGFEIVSHPFTLKYHKKEFEWKKVFETLIETNAYVNNFCGLHLHVNKDFFETIEQIKLGLFVYRHSSMLQKIGGRKLNKYCKKFRKNVKYMNLSPNRYEIINFINRDTIEFRFPKSTIDYDKFISIIELIHAICMYCKENGIGVIARGKWTRFKKFVLSNKYPKLQKYFIGG